MVRKCSFYMRISSFQWLFFVLINARANGNNVFTDIFLVHPVNKIIIKIHCNILQVQLKLMNLLQAKKWLYPNTIHYQTPLSAIFEQTKSISISHHLIPSMVKSLACNSSHLLNSWSKEEQTRWTRFSYRIFDTIHLNKLCRTLPFQNRHGWLEINVLVRWKRWKYIRFFHQIATNF